MSEKTTTEKKSGFFTRMFNKIDTVMKEKADQQKGCCCCESEGSGATESCSVEQEVKPAKESCCSSTDDRKPGEKCC